MIDILNPDFKFEDARGTLTQLVRRGYSQFNVVTSKVNLRMKFIMSGLSLANFLRRTVYSILDIHLNNSIQISPELISYITTGIELIKVVEAQFYKIMPKLWRKS